MKRTYSTPALRSREWGGLTEWDGVKHWPTFLLRRVPKPLRDELSAEAAHEDVSVQDVIRQILCAHYNMNCPHVSYHSDGRGLNHPDVLLRLQPKLTRRLTKTSAEEGLPIRTLIIQALEAHYG